MRSVCAQETIWTFNRATSTGSCPPFFVSIFILDLLLLCDFSFFLARTSFLWNVQFLLSAFLLDSVVFSVCLYAGKTSPLTARDSVQSLCSQHDHCRLFHISVPATIHRHGHFWILTTDQGISRIFLEPRLELCHCTDTTKSILGTLLKHGQSSNLNWS